MCLWNWNCYYLYHNMVLCLLAKMDAKPKSLNPDACTFMPKFEEMQKQLNQRDEDIVALKLLYFDAKIQLHRKEEVINGLRTFIANQLQLAGQASGDAARQ